MMVPYECTRKGCDYKRRENAAASYVAHYDNRGNEHPMRKVREVTADDR